MRRRRACRGRRRCSSRRLDTELLADSKCVGLELGERLLWAGVDGSNHAHAAVADVGVSTLLAVDPDGGVLMKNRSIPC